MTNETFVDSDGDTWQRHEHGIDWNKVPSTWIEKHGGAWGRAYAFGTFEPFAPGDSALYHVNAAWAALMPGPEPERPETWTDCSDDVWRRDGSAVRYDGSSVRWRVVGDGKLEMQFADGVWSSDLSLDSAREAWAMLIGDPLPASDVRPETVEIAGLVWFRSHAGIDSGATDLDSYVGFRDGVLGRIWSPGYPVRFTPYNDPSWDAHAANVRTAWEVLIGPWPETAPPEAAQVEPEWDLSPLADLDGLEDGESHKAPAHHWSFRCAPDRLDVARIFTEMSALGVPREQVSITIRARGKRSIRVAVHSGVGR